MSIRIMSAVWELKLPDSEKLIALALADWCNDQGVCWPSVAQIAAKCSKSVRTVQGALMSLEKQGYLSRETKPGKGCIWTLTPAAAAPRKDRTPAESAPPQPLRNTPAAAAPNTSVTINTSQKTSSSSRARASKATQVASNFTPHPPPGSLTEKAMAAWPPGEIEQETEHFIDYHLSHGTLSKDWQASWRTWVKNWKNFNGNRTQRRLDGQPDLRGSRPNPALDLLRHAEREISAGQSASDGEEADCRAWLALSSRKSAGS